MVLSAVHTLSTRENLRQAHERQQSKALWDEEFGSCRRCEDDSLNLPSCKECINGGGKKKLFRSKTMKRRGSSHLATDRYTARNATRYFNSRKV